MSESPETKHVEPLEATEVPRSIKVKRIQAQFNDEAVLARIGDKLLSQGVVSGYTTRPSIAGYVHNGEKVQGTQWTLDILVPEERAAEAETVKAAIREEVGKQWDVPAIEETDAVVDENYLQFIERAKVQFERYRSERKSKLRIATAALATIGGLGGIILDGLKSRWEQEAVEEQRVVAVERVTKAYRRVLQRSAEIERKITAGEPLQSGYSDMAAVSPEGETDEILHAMNDLLATFQKPGLVAGEGQETTNTTVPKP